MKAEWIVYGPDEKTDAGWQVLKKSSGLTKKDENVFINLCGTVPLPNPQNKNNVVYFGYVNRGRCFLGYGEYTGTDRFGREGAWKYYGFIFSSPQKVQSPCRLTGQLLDKCKAKDSTDPLDIDTSSMPASASSVTSSLIEMFNDRGALTFTLPNDEFQKICAEVDGLIQSARSEMPTYVFPAGKRTEEFNIVGLTLSAAQKETPIIPVATTSFSKRWRRPAMIALVVLAISGVLFGMWGCMLSRTKQQKINEYESRFHRIEIITDKMQRKMNTLRYIKDNGGEELNSIFLSEAKRIKKDEEADILFTVKSQSYGFENKKAQTIMETILDLSENIDSLSNELSDTTPVQEDSNSSTDQDQKSSP
ncbi:hypothetical protein AKJ51_03470 [candidate division MSBL1 archaeon SCGC-AAA382A20]|uniref:Uncharacterized protein n=1 Tax=candidate division MSBL1 archaeon SCGC-AAA382A20 TaxID=1698280 RepID=A0A133VJG9_9EURY|nr:hypothetical protein AKJ51_03470 [candidate division MSBL1 archaeon SCGC-AAA382A20]